MKKKNARTYISARFQSTYDLIHFFEKFLLQVYTKCFHLVIVPLEAFVSGKHTLIS